MNKIDIIANWRNRLKDAFLHLCEIKDAEYVNVIFDLDFDINGGNVVIILKMTDYLKFEISCTIVDELIRIQINRYASILLDVGNFVEYVYRNIIAPEIDRVKQLYVQGL